MNNKKRTLAEKLERAELMAKKASAKLARVRFSVVEKTASCPDPNCRKPTKAPMCSVCRTRHGAEIAHPCE